MRTRKKDLVLIIIFVMDVLHVTVFLLILHVITSTFSNYTFILYYFLKNTLILKKIAKCCPTYHIKSYQSRSL